METKANVGYHSDMPTYARSQGEMNVLEDLSDYFRKYARERPQALALTCFAIGFILGWKLKPW
ncbi:MAG TPA: hypothetical protein VKU82_08235 [Planctomycetaceae bacterium]|nr:hypothetical protein [Planctomycetaceae bacterium]